MRDVIFIPPHPEMVSLSHWGMFEGHPPPPMMAIPAGFDFADFERDYPEFMRPNGFIEIVRR